RLTGRRDPCLGRQRRWPVRNKALGRVAHGGGERIRQRRRLPFGPAPDLGGITLPRSLALQHMVSRAQDWGFRRVACGKFVRRREPRFTPSTRAPCGARWCHSLPLKLGLAPPCPPARPPVWKC